MIFFACSSRSPAAKCRKSITGNRTSNLLPNNFLPQSFLLVHYKAGPQLFMPPYHLLQAPLQRGDIQIAFEFPRQGHVIEVTAWLELVEKPKLLLLVRKRENRRS